MLNWNALCLASALLGAKFFSVAFSSPVSSRKVFHDLTYTSTALTREWKEINPTNIGGIENAGEDMANPEVGQQWLDAYNSLRETNATPKLKWNSKLEEFASNWTEQCREGHSDSNVDGVAFYYQQNAGSGGGKLEFGVPWLVAAVLQEGRPNGKELPVESYFDADGKLIFDTAPGHMWNTLWKDITHMACSLKTDCPKVYSNDGQSVVQEDGGWIHVCNLWPLPDMNSLSNAKGNVTYPTKCPQGVDCLAPGSE